MTEFKHTRLDNRQFTREDIKGFIQELIRKVKYYNSKNEKFLKNTCSPVRTGFHALPTADICP